MNAIKELRLMISSELERMKFLLSERRRMLLAGVAKGPVCFGVSQQVRLIFLWLFLFGKHTLLEESPFKIDGVDHWLFFGV